MGTTELKAGHPPKGILYQDGVTIFRVGNDYLTVAKDGTILSFVKNATPNVGVAARYARLGGALIRQCNLSWSLLHSDPGGSSTLSVG